VQPTQIVATGGTPYWILDGENFVLTASAAGEVTSIDVGAGGRFITNALAANATTVFVAESIVNVGDIAIIPVGSTVPTTFAAVNAQEPLGITTDPAFVYWTETATTEAGDASTLGGWIVRAPLTGGAPTTLAASPEPFAIAVAGPVIYWSDLTLAAVFRMGPTCDCPGVP
jgi:hypothetical protein